MLSEIKKLRKELHKYPEISGCEINTAKRIKEFITTHHKTEIIDELGGYGLAAIYSYSEDGPTIVIRCELDALPINDQNTFDHKSKIAGISHKCGHDGHMAIVAGLIFWLKEQTFSSGKVILLFQPAEETGKGAYKVLNNEKFKGIDIDYVFALHNMPGEPLNSIITIENYFSATVQSMAVYLTGKESHASEPEHGINPALGISEIISSFSTLIIDDTSNKNFSVLTPIHISMGDKAYGISPALGEVHYTLRTWSEESMNKLKENINSILSEICHRYQLEFKVDWFEYFPAVQSNSSCNKLITDAAKKNSFELTERPFPLKFGEDFGWFSKDNKVAMFGLGSGLSSPALHHADYDFPEEIIETGMAMFKIIITDILAAKPN